MFGKEEEEINFFFALLKTIQPTVKHEESIRPLFSLSRMCAVKIIKKKKIPTPSYGLNPRAIID